MSENLANEVQAPNVEPQKPQQISTAEDMANLLKGQFASSALKVYVNSLDQEVTFREITVTEQKSLTRVMQANERRKDVIYDAQCAMINNACLTQGFNIYNCSEFDRLKLMMALYQTNMSSNNVKFTCEECGAENTYQLDFDNVLHRLDTFDLAEKPFHYENKKFAYDFVIQYPNVRTVRSFHESYCRTHNKNVPRREMSTNENMQNMEYVNLFIKSLVFTNKATGQKTDVDFSKFPVSAYETILNTFPQDVLYSDDGVLKFIVVNMIQPINDSFDKHQCYNCGTVHEKENANQAESFF